MKRYEALRSVTLRAKRYVTLLFWENRGTATKRYSTSEALRYVTLHFCFEIKLRNVRKLRFLIFQQNEREGKERR